MSKQSIEDKAREYLLSGSLKVEVAGPTSARLKVQGSGNEPYVITFRESGWACDCPARVSECAHIYAAKLISGLRPTDTVHIGTEDDDITSFLSSYKKPDIEYEDEFLV